MRITSLLAATVIASSALATAAGPVMAAPAPATAEVLATSFVQLVPDRGTALVSGTFRCTGKLSHLWVSAKQGPGDLTQEGSGAMARAWYQASYDNEIRCDGKVHTRTFEIQATKGTLYKGQAYVQFCLLSANTPEEAQEGKGGFDSNMRYRAVRWL